MANGNPPSDPNKKGYPLPLWVIALLVIAFAVVPFLKKTPVKNHPLIGSPAPELSFLDTVDGPHALSEFRGGVVLVNFWASWCEPCMEEMPSLRQLEDRLASKPFKLLMLNVGEVRTDVFQRVPRNSLPSQVFFGVNEEALDPYQVGSIPVSFLIDAKGTIRQSYLGPRAWTSSEVLNEIQSLL